MVLLVRVITAISGCTYNSTLTGIIVNEDGKPAVGLSVTLKMAHAKNKPFYATILKVTDKNGKFGMRFPQPTETLYCKLVVKRNEEVLLTNTGIWGHGDHAFELVCPMNPVISKQETENSGRFPPTVAH